MILLKYGYILTFQFGFSPTSLQILIGKLPAAESVASSQSSVSVTGPAWAVRTGSAHLAELVVGVMRYANLTTGTAPSRCCCWGQM